MQRIHFSGRNGSQLSCLKCLSSCYKGSLLSNIFGTCKKSNNVKFVPVGTTYLLVAVGLSGILKGKQNLDVTFDSDKLGSIDFKKVFKIDHVQYL